MNGTPLVQWAENLPEAEAQLMLLHAANEHPAKFTAPDDIGMGWNHKLRHNGFAALPPYARDYMAHRFQALMEMSFA